MESAARSMAQGNYGDIDFVRVFIANKKKLRENAHTRYGPYESENNPINYLATLRNLLALNPDIVICSLWRSCFVALLFQLLRPKTRLVSFLHTPHAVHIPDYVFNSLVGIFAAQVWADSETTLRGRVPRSRQQKSHVISFVLDHRASVATADLQPAFVYWGRLHPRKGLSRAIRLFAQIRRLVPAASYTIVGPDAGDGTALRKLCRELGIADAVRFAGPMDYSQIAAEASSHSFYLQTSETEGMAMSVVEAMQLGLVPIVTHAGEIAAYCTDDENSLIVDDDEQALSRVIALLANPVQYDRLRSNARNHWHDRPLYRDSVLTACRAILARMK